MVIKKIQFTFIEKANVHRLNVDLTAPEDTALSCNPDVGIPAMTIDRAQFLNTLHSDMHDARQGKMLGGIRFIFDDGSEEVVIIST